MARWFTATNWPQTGEEIGLPHVQPDVREADCFAAEAVGVEIGKSFHTVFFEGNPFPRTARRVVEEDAQFLQFKGLESIAGVGMERANTILSSIFLLQKNNI